MDLLYYIRGVFVAKLKKLYLKTIYIKKLYKDTILPSRATFKSIGLDVYAHSVTYSGNYIEYGLGFAATPPEGYYITLAARSSVSNKGLILANGIGIGDPDFVAEYKMRFYRVGEFVEEYKLGERIGQLILLPINTIILEE